MGGRGQHGPGHPLAQGHGAEGLGLLGREQPRVRQRRRGRGSGDVALQAADVPAAEGRAGAAEGALVGGRVAGREAGADGVAAVSR